jgi:hypothetical protein
VSKDRGARILQETTGYSYQRCVQLVRKHWTDIAKIATEKEISNPEAIKVFGKRLGEK